ncbi:MAG: glycosyltransferase family 2 protein [Caulobacter sp.]|nr:glycosyltransferase family 2 protein [Caulobacter sp.]
MSTIRISALVCVHNEEDRLADCLQRLRFTDEIVVVLDRCTDGSAEIAARMADKVIVGAFPLEGPRRFAGLSQCSGDWILEIDADEFVSDALASEVRSTVETCFDADHFLLPVDNFVGSRLIRHGWGGSFGTTAVTRLYRAGVKSWKPHRVHPGVNLAGRAGGRLQNALVHLVDVDVSDMLQRLDRYTQARALDLIDRGEVGSLTGAAFRGVRRFWKCYVSRKGYLEGGWGVLIATMAALFAFLSVLRARLILNDAAEARPGSVEFARAPRSHGVGLA